MPESGSMRLGILSTHIKSRRCFATSLTDQAIQAQHISLTSRLANGM